ncbi:MAG: hypothetical protein ABI691_00340 [Ginsengibacter sp.]
MKMRIYKLSIVVATLLFITGCGPSAVVVHTRPAPPVYARPIAPGPNYVWIDGEWLHRGRHYTYRKGYWAPPRARYHQYMGGHWQQRRSGWYWVPGHWN